LKIENTLYHHFTSKEWKYLREGIQFNFKTKKEI